VSRVVLMEDENISKTSKKETSRKT